MAPSMTCLEIGYVTLTNCRLVGKRSEFFRGDCHFNHLPIIGFRLCPKTCHAFSWGVDCRNALRPSAQLLVCEFDTSAQSATAFGVRCSCAYINSGRHARSG